MTKKKNLEFLKSNYTLRKTHKTLKGDIKVFERDYMVTTNGGSWDSGSIPYGESNFKFIDRDDRKELRKHNYGKWLKTDNGSEYWTMEDIQKQIEGKKSSTCDESRMNIKPVYSSLLDFAYFGNCTEMIKASVNDIISKYPGEMFVTEQPVTYYNGSEFVRLGTEDGYDNLCFIANPYGIDIYTPYVSKTKKNSEGYDELKYFCESRDKYKILYDVSGTTEVYCEPHRWILDFDGDRLVCPIEGDLIGRVLISGEYDSSLDIKENFTGDSQFVIYVYYANGEIVYLADSKWSGFHIRPIDSAVDKFYNKLDDFERFLLNRDSIPLYSITIDTMEESERGFSFSKKTFVWPTMYGWNLDVESTNYNNYLNGLLEQAGFYDELFSDNLWRMMVHDSIKNMDLTFSNPSKDEDKSDYNIGTTKVQGLFWAIGRLFDDIKRYIDNIGSVNQITYSQSNNISDYLLTDKLELNGWETYNPTETLDSDTEVEGSELFPGVTKKYTLEDVKSLFYGALNINSKDIFSRKGTRQAIEMVLALFGLNSYDYGKALYMATPGTSKKSWDNLEKEDKQKYYDYELNEYVAVVSNTSGDVVDIEDELPIERYNKLKTSYIESNEFTGPQNPLQGLPVREITIEVLSTDEEETSYKKYLIPWFSKTDKLDGNMYFQMYGGWSDLSIKKISEEIAPDVNVIRSDKTFKVYSETQKYLKYKANLRDLVHNRYDTLKNGDIFYVNDIETDSDKYLSGVSDPSNYFILVDKENFTEFGDNAWKNIPKSDIEKGIFDGIKVLYLESLIDDNKGNNPHVGYGDYDDGAEYLNYFKQIFKYTIDSDTYENPTFVDEAYDCETGELNEEIKKCGFNVSDLILDNMKVWYFTADNVEPLPIIVENSVPVDGEDYTVSSGYEDAGFRYEVKVGKDSVKNKQTKLTTDLEAFNLETQENNSNSESAADSIINVKNLEIKFADKFSENEGFKEYLYNVIVPYVNQVIPSTTISKIYVDGADYSITCNEYAEVTGTVDDGYHKVRYYAHEENEFQPPMW